MNRKRLIAISMAILALLLASCGQPSIEQIPTTTSIPPSATASITLTPSPTSTPSATPTATLTPTPIGGEEGLLLAGHSCHINTGDSTTNCRLYIYDMNSRRTSLLIEGYSSQGISPDGKKVALQRYEGERADLFMMDITHPEEIALLYEDVVPYESVWFPGTEWIGFIAKKNGVRQVFIIHPDGTGLTQVTKSKVGAIRLFEVFHEGVFWGEGIGEGIKAVVNKHKWTQLDGTEDVFKNFALAVFPDGRSAILKSDSQDLECGECNYDLFNLETGEVEEIFLSDPQPKSGYLDGFIQPLSSGKWLVTQWRVGETPPEYWIYSSNGSILIDFSTFVHHHEAVDADTKDYYGIIGGEWDLSGQRLSPDGNWLLIAHILESQIPMINSSELVTWADSTFYLLNVSTSELRELPGLSFDLDSSDDDVPATYVGEFWWVKLP